MINTADKHNEKAISVIRELLDPEMTRFEKMLMAKLEDQKEYLTNDDFQFYLSGKRLRPMLLIISAKINHPRGIDEPVSNKAISAAVSLEMMHAGSLIHDDIVDVAPLRRGLPTINASRGNDVALLMGDLQLIESMRNFISVVKTDEDIRLVKHYLNTAFDLCRGELDELKEEPGWGTDYLRKRYLKTIDRKTGQLISLSCEAGARIAGASYGMIEEMQRFGLYLGRAFQIADDLKELVYTSEMNGKQEFTDLENGRIVLPFIYAMENQPDENALKIVLEKKKQATKEELNAARKMIFDSNGIEKAFSEAKVYQIKAENQLSNYKENVYVDALRQLIHTIM